MRQLRLKGRLAAFAPLLFFCGFLTGQQKRIVPSELSQLSSETPNMLMYAVLEANLENIRNRMSLWDGIAIPETLYNPADNTVYGHVTVYKSETDKNSFDEVKSTMQMVATQACFNMQLSVGLLVGTKRKPGPDRNNFKIAGCRMVFNRFEDGGGKVYATWEEPSKKLTFE